MKNEDLFLDWFNNFLTFKALAEHYNLTERQAAKKVKKGYVLHESKFSSILFDVNNDYEPVRSASMKST